MNNNCDVDRWPLCCKAHRTEVYAEMAADTVAAAKSEGCTWHVLVPNTTREIDFPSDLYDEVQCGAKVTTKVAPSGAKGWECENGHSGWEYGSPEQQGEELEHEFNERRAEGYC